MTNENRTKIGVYVDSGHRITTVQFRWRWQALLFHVLLNASESGHSGSVY